MNNRAIFIHLTPAAKVIKRFLAGKAMYVYHRDEILPRNTTKIIVSKKSGDPSLWAEERKRRVFLIIHLRKNQLTSEQRDIKNG
jgi:hypothetical protein